MEYCFTRIITWGIPFLHAICIKTKKLIVVLNFLSLVVSNKSELPRHDVLPAEKSGNLQKSNVLLFEIYFRKYKLFILLPLE